MRLVLALAVTLLTFVLLMMLIRIKVRQHKDLVNRMEYFSGSAVRLRQQELRGTRTAAVAKDRFREFVRKAGLFVQRLQHRGNSMDFKMQQADWPLLGSEFEVMLAIIGAICAVITLAATFEPVFAVLAFAGGILAGRLFLHIYIKRRQKAFAVQLGDMLTMVANALRAGFSFMQAFELIAREMDAPMGREVQKVVSEVNFGATLETALDNMQKRVASSDFELVVTAVLIQRQVGGNLAQILDTISETINERIRMRREVMALTAQGRMSGIVLALLPVALGIFLNMVSPDYMRPLLEEPMGRMAIIGAVILEIIGFVVIRKIVDIKV
ncbi:MAG: type II secretion system F family protein [Selenomonas sp.]|uniref:type II secretion system F family protein n=1 Tax=Selenomonas sp. TaxID=2053611 RepID=UPI0025E93050|nr:type II secretion system F family protein [Selenomonas sp.]MCR5757218.1 type II secretion system F family protein [Selenomonas sp.]